MLDSSLTHLFSHFLHGFWIDLDALTQPKADHVGAHHAVRCTSPSLPVGHLPASPSVTGQPRSQHGLGDGLQTTQQYNVPLRVCAVRCALQTFAFGVGAASLTQPPLCSRCIPHRACAQVLPEPRRRKNLRCGELSIPSVKSVAFPRLSVHPSDGPVPFPRMCIPRADTFLHMSHITHLCACGCGRWVRCATPPWPSRMQHPFSHVPAPPPPREHTRATHVCTRTPLV